MPPKKKEKRKKELLVNHCKFPNYPCHSFHQLEVIFLPLVSFDVSNQIQGLLSLYRLILIVMWRETMKFKLYDSMTTSLLIWMLSWREPKLYWTWFPIFLNEVSHSALEVPKTGTTFSTQHVKICQTKIKLGKKLK